MTTRATRGRQLDGRRAELGAPVLAGAGRGGGGGGGGGHQQQPGHGGGQQPRRGHRRARHGGCRLELQTDLREDFTITEKAPRGLFAFIAFTSLTLC